MQEGQGKGVNVDVRTGETTKYVVYGLVGIAVIAITYFGILKPVLNKLGVTRSKDDRKGERDASQLSRKQVLSNSLYREYPSNVTITSAQANAKAIDVHNGKGVVWDDETLAVGAVTSAGSLVNISYISDTFNRLYGKSMESYMESYLEPENWTQIDNYIEKTKKF